MKISALQAWLERVKAEHGDIDVACMTAPCFDGETEVLSEQLLGVTDEQPNNGSTKSQMVVSIGYVR